MQRRSANILYISHYYHLLCFFRPHIFFLAIYGNMVKNGDISNKVVIYTLSSQKSKFIVLSECPIPCWRNKLCYATHRKLLFLRSLLLQSSISMPFVSLNCTAFSLIEIVKLASLDCLMNEWGYAHSLARKALERHCARHRWMARSQVSRSLELQLRQHSCPQQDNQKELMCNHRIQHHWLHRRSPRVSFSRCPPLGIDCSRILHCRRNSRWLPKLADTLRH